MVHQLLKQYFGYSSFRPMQQEIIEHVLAGGDAMALLPTGGGKSVCFQIPALATQGICLVISPLIALMKDQVQRLHRMNISALALHSGMSGFEVRKAYENAASGQFKFLYLSPERIQSRLFKEYLPGLPINLIAVDEAHCISQWGYDFRPPYLQIAEIRRELAFDVPILALTASATTDVQQDICDKLELKQPRIFRQSFEKPNLSFSVFETPHKFNKLLEIVTRVQGTGLVYVRNRRRTAEIAQHLINQGISADFYHAGLTHMQRATRQQDWISNRTRIMVCTNAFGMGIDKPDVRTVVHIDIPDLPESYYQEAGRAGRDGQKAYAVLLYHAQDIDMLRGLPAAKFPEIAQIKKIYDEVCNFLQVPVNGGQAQYFDFDLNTFCSRFKRNALLVHNCLQTLSGAGYITYSESVFLQSKVGFTINRAGLEDFENSHPQFEPLIKALLRGYEGIFDHVVNIREASLAKLTGLSEEQVINSLHVLANYSIIHFSPMLDTPQLYFIYHRVPANQLLIDKALYEKRKLQYAQKVQSMETYTLQASECRSAVLRRYFEDDHIQPCGICDICLQKKSAPVTDAQLQQWAAQILHTLTPGQNTLTQLQQRHGLSKAQVQQALAELIKENKISWIQEGTVFKT